MSFTEVVILEGMKKISRYLQLLTHQNKLFSLGLKGSISSDIKDKVTDCQVCFVEGKSVYCLWKLETTKESEQDHFHLNISYGPLDLSFPCLIQEQWSANEQQGKRGQQLNGVKLQMGPLSVKHHWQLLKLRWSLLKNPPAKEDMIQKIDQAA